MFDDSGEFSLDSIKNLLTLVTRDGYFCVNLLDIDFTLVSSDFNNDPAHVAPWDLVDWATSLSAPSKGFPAMNVQEH